MRFFTAENRRALSLRRENQKTTWSISEKNSFLREKTRSNNQFQNNAINNLQLLKYGI